MSSWAQIQFCKLRGHPIQRYKLYEKWIWACRCGQRIEWAEKPFGDTAREV